MSKKNNVSAPVGFKTKKGANNKTQVITNQKKTMSKEEKRNLIITVVGSVLIVLIVALIAATVIMSIIGEDKFDYLKENLSKYITVSKDEYSNITVDIDPEVYSDAMLEREIDALLVKHKNKEALDEGKSYVSKPITLGDIAHIRYRGYTVDAEGRETEIEGACNFGDENPLALEIGSKAMILGFEKALIGKIPENYKAFDKLQGGQVREGDVIYLSYIAYYPSGAAKSVENERIDLSRSDLDSVYGEGFSAYFVGKDIQSPLGSATFKKDNGTAAYSDMKIEYATRCESEPLTIDVTFPKGYTNSNGEGQNLRGVAAKFDIYIDKTVEYATPDYNAEFVSNTLGFSNEDLAAYEGADIVAKHTAYLKAQCEKQVEQTNKALVREAVWNKIKGLGTVIKYPEAEYERVYGNYYESVEDYLSANGESKGYKTIDDAAIDYFGLPYGTDWQAYVKGRAEGEIREDLALYYIMKKEGFVPTDEEYAAYQNEIVENEVQIYLSDNEDKFEKFEGAEYDEQVDILRREIREVYQNIIKYMVHKNVCLDKLVEAKYVTVI